MASVWTFGKGRWCCCYRCSDLRQGKKENEGATDGEPLSVSSPRRILSFNKDKRKNVTFPNGDGTGFGVFREYGPKPSEVYGFVGSITTIVATATFLVWAYVPETWLHAIGIHCYPSRYCALALPTSVTVTVFLALIFYIGLNFLSCQLLLHP